MFGNYFKRKKAEKTSKDEKAVQYFIYRRKHGLLSKGETLNVPGYDPRTGNKLPPKVKKSKEKQPVKAKGAAVAKKPPVPKPVPAPAPEPAPEPDDVWKRILNLYLQYGEQIEQNKDLATRLSRINENHDAPDVMEKLDDIEAQLNMPNKGRRGKGVYKKAKPPVVDNPNVIVEPPVVANPPVINPNAGEGKSGYGSAWRPKGPRAYEMSAKQLAANPFNPGNVKEIADVQKEIDAQKTWKDSFRVFAHHYGNDNMKFDVYDEKSFNNVDVKLFQAKLKHMYRMIYDYPELRGKIMSFHQLTDRTGMNAGPYLDEKNLATIGYNDSFDRKGEAEDKKRRDVEKERQSLGLNKQYSASDSHHTGNHELGHVLNSLLFKNMDSGERVKDWNSRHTSNLMLQEVINRLIAKNKLPKETLNKLKYFERTEFWKATGQIKGDIITKQSKLNELGLTSEYGSKTSAEFFAEAFADVYQYGKDARPASIELVKLYEEKYDALKAS